MKGKTMNKRTVLVLLFLLLGAAGPLVAQQVMMNEIQARGVAGALDWIELYNPKSVQVSLNGYKIYDIGGQGGTKTKKPFPVSAVIPAKGFYVIITDTADFTGDNSGFGLSSSGEKVWLEDSAGAIIDTVTFGVTASAAQTYGRGPDGGAWVVLNTVTRGSSNGKILMNEIQARGVAGALDWIEIYNSVSASVNITGYKIYDVGGQGGTKSKKRFPNGTTLPANGFYVIITDTTDFAGDNSGFGLSSSGEKVWLEDTTGAIIDTVTFGVTASAAETYGRYPDGGPWKVLTTVTRGTSNGGSTAVDDVPAVVTNFQLDQNYPNPFNPSTVISFQMPAAADVRLAVFNLLGQEVALLAQARLEAGQHSFRFDAAGLPSGVYLYRLSAGSFSQTRKMALVR
jgi:hypothetical protein